MYRALTKAVLAAAIVALPLTAAANPEAIAARKAQMQAFGAQVQILGGMAQGRIPYDAAAARAAADALYQAAQVDVAPLFPAGSDNASASGTRALPAIWSSPADFAERYAALQTASDALRGVAGDSLDALRGGMAGVGGSCGACHQQYRAQQ